MEALTSASQRRFSLILEPDAPFTKDEHDRMTHVTLVNQLGIDGLLTMTPNVRLIALEASQFDNLDFVTSLPRLKALHI